MLTVLALDNLLDVEQVEVPDDATGLLKRREAARAKHDWTEADRLRDELRAMGWEIRDNPNGPELLPRG